MSIELDHDLELTRALVVSGDLGRAASQLNRLRTLDVHQRVAREANFLALVLSVRSQALESVERDLGLLAPISELEQRQLSEMLAATPEAVNAEYQRWVRRLFKRSDAMSSSTRRSKQGIGMPLLVGGVSVLALLLVFTAVVLLRPRQRTAVDSLSSLLDSLRDGDFVAVWDSFPPTYQADADVAFRAMATRIPAKSLEDLRTIDAGLSSVVFERLSMLRGSRVESIGPYFRTLSGENDARALARYFLALSGSGIYDPAWLSQATVRDFATQLTGGSDFNQCWKTYFRTSALEDSVWQSMLGIQGMTVGQIVTSPHTYGIASPDDGSGRVVVAILLPPGQRVDVTMRLVEGRWIPEPLHDNWRMAMLQIQANSSRADSALEFVKRMQSTFSAKAADARKLAIIDAQRARTQEEFDEAAKRYLAN